MVPASRVRTLVATACLAVATLSRTAHAHPLPETRAWLDVRADGAHLQLHIPLNRLEFAVGKPLADHPGTLLAQDSTMLSRYLLQHIGMRSDNVGWQVLRPRLAVAGDDRRAELVADIDLVAPPGVDARRMTLLYDAVTHEVRTHRVQLLLRNDWPAGVVAQPPRPLAELRFDVREARLDLDAPRLGGAWGSLVRNGAWHIAEGTDHLLFLLMLLLVAPVMAEKRRWSGARTAAAARRSLLFVVSGFTLGHSITLALGSLGLLTPPSSIVEAAVALTIIVAAVHAIRPLFAKAELVMAIGFGLIHGLAFSSSLDGAGLTTWQHAQALLAFNVGIELMQVALVAAIVPLLLLMLRRAPRGYATLRVTMAALGVIAATFWTYERVSVGAGPGSFALPATNSSRAEVSAVRVSGVDGAAPYFRGRLPS